MMLAGDLVRIAIRELIDIQSVGDQQHEYDSNDRRYGANADTGSKCSRKPDQAGKQRNAEERRSRRKKVAQRRIGQCCEGLFGRLHGLLSSGMLD